jgi:hypothetical protein
MALLSFVATTRRCDTALSFQQNFIMEFIAEQQKGTALALEELAWCLNAAHNALGAGH